MLNILNTLVYQNLVSLRNKSFGIGCEIDLFFNRIFVYILDFFYRTGFIGGYKYVSVMKLRIFLKFTRDKGLLYGVNFYKEPCFTFKALKYLYRSIYVNSFLYYFTTPKGFCTLDELFFKRFNIGGILYFYIRLL